MRRLFFSLLVFVLLLAGVAPAQASGDVYTALAKVERQIAASPVEISYSYLSTGAFWLRQVGGATKIETSSTDARLLSGGYKTHNHPKPWLLPPSYDDFMTAATANLLEERVVSTNLRNPARIDHRVLRRTGKTWGTISRDRYDQVLQQTMHAAGIYYKEHDGITTISATPVRAEAALDDVWRALASEGGFEYEAWTD